MNNKDLLLEECQLQEQVACLSVAQKRKYYAQAFQQIKDPDTYAILNWAFVIGLHHFYLGNWWRGSLNLSLMLLGITFYFSNFLTTFGLVLVVGVFIAELPMLFNSQNVIYQHNNQSMRRILKQIN